jgi:TetR/AcrR family transcriptional repressor of lmrAB and yxaGH operons
MLEQNLRTMNEIADATATAPEFLTRYLDALSSDLVDSEYQAGCPCVPIATELARSSPAVDSRTQRFFTEWPQELARHLEEKGVPAERAHDVALLAVAAIEEGVTGLVLGKARRSAEPMSAIARQLAVLADS